MSSDAEVELSFDSSESGFKLTELDAASKDLLFPGQFGNVDPITGGFLVAGGVMICAKLIIRARNEAKGGTVIDLSASPVAIRRDKGLAFGYFVVISRDGSKATIKAVGESPDSLERLIGKILAMNPVTATADTVKHLVDSTPGHRAEVSTSPPPAT
jgi:hypothetical protein